MTFAYTPAVQRLITSFFCVSAALAVGCSKPEPAKDAPSEQAANDAPAEPAAKDAAKPEVVAKAPAAPTPAVEAEVGKPAPDFTLTDLSGKEMKLADLRGKNVVLEWFNPECPFVVYAHEDGPLKAMAKELGGEDLVWLAINSGAEGKQGFGADVNSAARDKWSMGHPILLDPTGEVGRKYGAVKTPQVYLIDAEGTLRYAGGLDNAPIGKPEAGAAYSNYLDGAVSSLRASKPIDPSETKPYGCSVKYAS